MKNIFIGIVLIGILILTGVVAYQMATKPKEISVAGEITPTVAEDELVGADRDEHGCIGSAGYTWCEAKQKCLRIWEEECGDSEEDKAQIAQALAKKHSKNIEEVTVTFREKNEDYAFGSVNFYLTRWRAMQVCFWRQRSRENG
ncbi:MAG: hypothetical protein ACOX6N_02575 [Patescibacteria group bacterium]|jgi:hypothetical protein